MTAKRKKKLKLYKKRTQERHELQQKCNKNRNKHLLELDVEWRRGGKVFDA